MKDEQLQKEYLRERIIPLLFSTKNAKLFPGARSTLRNDEEITRDELKEEYEGKDKKDEEFWNKISRLVSESYDEDQPEFSGENFADFIKSLLEIRFKQGFRKNDIKKLSEAEDIEGFIGEIRDQDHNLVVKDNSEKKFFWVGERSTSEFSEPMKIQEEDYYPPLQVKISEDESKMVLSGDKSQRGKFVFSTHDSEDIKLEDEEPESYEEFSLDPSFLSQLNSQDMFLRKINFSRSDLSLTVSSDDEGTIDIRDFVDYDLLLQEKRDILAINSCKFTYIADDDKEVEFKLNFQNFQTSGNEGEFLKIALELKDKFKPYREEIEDILEDHGLEVYEPYLKPRSHYFNEFLRAYSHRQDRYFTPMKELENPDELEYMEGAEIIDYDDGEVSFNKSGLVDELESKIEDAKQTEIEFRGRNHKIKDIKEKESNKITLIIKSFSDDIQDDHRRFYEVTIPFRPRLGRLEKIYSVIVHRPNYHSILMEDNEEEIVKYIVRAAERQIKYHQKSIVQKEARRSARILEEYVEQPKEVRDRFDDERQAGYDIEDHVNVVLRYLFSNYLAAGGQNEADGALVINDKAFMIDSKQTKELSQEDINKGKKDLENSEYTNLVDSESMVFVINKNLLKTGTNTGSLNRGAQDRISRDEDIEFFFLSVESIVKLYEIFSQHSNELNSNLDLTDEIFEKIQRLIERSAQKEDSDELEEMEEEVIGEIRSIIDDRRHEYKPEAFERYF